MTEGGDRDQPGLVNPRRKGKPRGPQHGAHPGSPGAVRIMKTSATPCIYVTILIFAFHYLAARIMKGKGWTHCPCWVCGTWCGLHRALQGSHPHLQTAYVENFVRTGKPIDLDNGGIGGTQIDAHDSTWLDWKSDLRLRRGDQHECVHKVI